MRILLVNGNTTTAMTETLVATARQAAAPGTEIAGATGTIGGEIVTHRAEEAIAEHATLKAIADHEDPFDGVLIGVSTDPALGAARALVPVPVVGMTEAALLTACMLGGGSASSRSALPPPRAIARRSNATVLRAGSPVSEPSTSPSPKRTRSERSSRERSSRSQRPSSSRTGPKC